MAGNASNICYGSIRSRTEYNAVWAAGRQNLCSFTGLPTHQTTSNFGTVKREADSRKSIIGSRPNVDFLTKIACLIRALSRHSRMQ